MHLHHINICLECIPEKSNGDLSNQISIHLECVMDAFMPSYQNAKRLCHGLDSNI